MAKQFYQSFEKITAGFKMGLKMTIILFFICFFISGALLLFRINNISDNFNKTGLPKDCFKDYYVNKYTFCLFDRSKFYNPKMKLSGELKNIVKTDKISRHLYIKIIDRILQNIDNKHISDKFYSYFDDSLNNIFTQHLIFLFVLFILCILFFAFLSNEQSKKKHLRGAKILELINVENKLRKNFSYDHFINLDKIKIPTELIKQHIIFLGSPGTGKSVLLNQFLNDLIQYTHNTDSAKLIIYDLKGEFLSKWYDKDKDLIFFPFDERSEKYNPFNEIKTEIDFDRISAAHFPFPHGVDTHWHQCSRTVFRSGLYFLYKNKLTTINDILKFFTYDSKTMIDCFKTLPVQYQDAINHISDPRHGNSVMSTLHTGISYLKYLVGKDGDFSFCDYISKPKYNNSNLFISNISNYKEIFKPLMTFAFDMMISQLLSLPDDRDKFVLFLCDEFDSLGKINSLFDLLKVGRSKGGGLICSTQDLGFVSKTYGPDLKSSFLSNISSSFFFRINDPKTAGDISKVSEREITKTNEASSISPAEMGDRRSYQKQDKIEKLFLGSELNSLKDFHCFMKLSFFGISKYEVEKRFYDPKIEPFIDINKPL